MKAIMEFIQNVGFPCFVAVYLLVFMKTTLDKLENSICEQIRLIKQNNDEIIKEIRKLQN